MRHHKPEGVVTAGVDVVGVIIDDVVDDGVTKKSNIIASYSSDEVMIEGYLCQTTCSDWTIQRQGPLLNQSQ